MAKKSLDQLDAELTEKIKGLVYASNLNFDEAQLLFDGLQYLPMEDKELFILKIEEEPDLIYPFYNMYKTKLDALEADTRDLDEIVDDELNKLKMGFGKDDPENDI